MEVAVQYTKKRSEFGHHCVFDDEPSVVLESIPSTNEFDGIFIPKNPVVTTLDTVQPTATHEVNTIRISKKAVGMRFSEGGWPENVDAAEADQVDRFLKKANKEARYKHSVAALGATAEQAVRQNNTLDLYEQYFDGPETFASASAPASMRGVTVFRDPSPVKRSVTSIQFNPEGTQVAVAYSILKFQDERTLGSRLPTSSYVWDLATPNTPIAELTPPSPLVSLRFNAKTPDILVGGSYNGMVHIFDTKRPHAVAVSSSSIEKSHHDPVYDVFWVQSKTNNQFVSVSTDGRMLWWDSRKLSEPTDELLLTDPTARIMGASSAEYSIEAGPAKYLIGTEQGLVLSLNMRKKAAAGGGDSTKSKAPPPTDPAAALAATAAANASIISVMSGGMGKHHGPIYSIQRNTFHPINYLTVGDWSVRLWSEKNKTPIMMTPYSKAYLTGGAWSMTRAGVFFVTRNDGCLDAWDLSYRQSSPTYTHKVSDVPLTAVSAQGTTISGGGGRFIAVGDASGTVTILELSENLCVPAPSEKATIGAMFERESRREEALEKRAIAVARASKAAAANAAKTPGGGAQGAPTPLTFSSASAWGVEGSSGGGDSPRGFSGGEAVDPVVEEALRKADADFAALLAADAPPPPLPIVEPVVVEEPPPPPPVLEAPVEPVGPSGGLAKAAHEVKRVVSTAKDGVVNVVGSVGASVKALFTPSRPTSRGSDGGRATSPLASAAEEGEGEGAAESKEAEAAEGKVE